MCFKKASERELDLKRLVDDLPTYVHTAFKMKIFIILPIKDIHKHTNNESNELKAVVKQSKLITNQRVFIILRRRYSESRYRQKVKQLQVLPVHGGQ
jgi:hypothetical protein